MRRLECQCFFQEEEETDEGKERSQEEEEDSQKKHFVFLEVAFILCVTRESEPKPFF